MIRWRRGFFRAWVLLTVLWIAGSIGVYTEYLSSDEGDIVMNPTTKEYFVMRHGTWVACVGRDTPDEAKKELESCERARDWKLLQKAMWLLGPPFSVLALGAALGWVALGFRASP